MFVFKSILKKFVSSVVKGLLIWLQLLFFGLKIYNIVNWSFVVVLIPLWIWLGFTILHLIFSIVGFCVRKSIAINLDYELTNELSEVISKIVNERGL